MPSRLFSSVRLRAPAIIVALLALGVSAFGTVAYRAVRQSMLAATRLRMLSVAQQIVQLSQAQNATRTRHLRALADSAAVGAALRLRTPASLAAARRVLASLGPDTGLIVTADLRDSSGAVVLAVGSGKAHLTNRPLTGMDTATTSPLFVGSGAVLVEYGAPVLEHGRVVGRIGQVRHATTSGPSAGLKQLRNLIGSDAEFLTGNADGSVWTDLTTLIKRPPPDTKSLARYERDGRTRLSTSARYPGSPLVVAVEFPEDAVLAPLRTLLGGFTGLGLFVVLVGGALGWWMSNGFTGPVLRLTTAAETIASGNLESPITEAHRSDEVGRLSRAFETMRGSVKSAHDSLASQVEARTQELRAAQAELVKREKLAILGQLSSSVGHELRNPLGVMTNAVYFLDMTLADVPQKVHDYLGILRAQIRLSEKIVSDLLDFARVRTPQRARVTAMQIIDDQLARVTLPEGVRVERSVAPDAPPAFVDPVQVGQVVLNLITNAAQAMEQGGGVLSVCATARNGHLRLEVADTGPGIPPENIAHVFEPLFTTKARGIGLGLSVSQSLATANGAELAVVSEPGHGATFTLDLPTRAT